MTTMLDFAAAPGLFKRIDADVKRATRKGLRSAARAASAILVPRTPRDRGNAAAAWKNSDHSGEGNVVAYCLNTCPYIGILDLGARPHKVSWEGQFSIYLWIERHFRLTGNGYLVKGGTYGTSANKGRLTATSSRAFGLSQGREPISKNGAFVKRAILGTHPEYANRLVPAALNITGAIVMKIMTQGEKPKYFMRDAMPVLAEATRDEVERCLRAAAQKRLS
jgi:hypothetical protein